MLKLCLGFDVTWHEINIYLLADIKNSKNQYGPRSMFIFKGSSKFMSDFKSARKFKNGKQFSTKPILTHPSSLIPLQEIVTVKSKKFKIGIVIHLTGFIDVGDNHW